MIPILSTQQPRLRPDLEARLERTLAELLRERPDLSPDDDLGPLRARTLERGPTLHLDDQSAIDITMVSYDASSIQDRARMRAEEGDVVAASHPPPAGYEEYCQAYLGLGHVAWLTPRQTRYRRNLASHCWTDRDVRHELVRRLRADRLRYLHPLMGSPDVWQLARLLQRSSRRRLEVVAPAPHITLWVNNKVEFARLIRRLFGDGWLPPTSACSSVVAVSRTLRDLAAHHRVVGVKLPDAAAGGGNLVIRSESLRGRPLADVRADVRALLRRIGWRGERDLLVSAWESDVLSAPSAQLWIPLPPEPPVVEAIFEQIIEGTAGEFVGCRTAELPRGLVDEIVDRCWVVGRLFQRLGYLGRCSFDLVVVGKQLDRSRLEFIECNGRWGGTSLPMTLVNRLLPAGAPDRYVVRHVGVPRSGVVEFAGIVDHLADLLLDVRTGRGRIVLFNPLHLSLRGGLKLIALGQSTADVQRAEEEVRHRLATFFRQRAAAGAASIRRRR